LTVAPTVVWWPRAATAVPPEREDVRGAWVSLFAASLACLAGTASATTITVATGSVGRELQVLRQELDQFTARTGIEVAISSTSDSPLGTFGQYQRWLSGRNPEIDVYRMDITWAPQLARHLVDLAPGFAGLAATKLPALIKAVTVEDSLVALPYSADLPALYYRKDLLAKYHREVPTTWAELAATAAVVMRGERLAGQNGMWGYVFPGGVSEDLICNALEWVASNGGGSIVEDDGAISVDNVQAILAVEVAETWVGTISPPEVVDYTPIQSLKQWLSGQSVFARDWHDVIGFSEAPDSAIKGTVGVAELPRGDHGDKPAATLGGWSLAISRYSTHRDEAGALVRFLASAEAEKAYEVGALGRLPATAALYDDPEVAMAQPEIGTFKRILAHAVLRPAATTGEAYGRVSIDFAVAINRSLRQDAFAEDFLQSYRHNLEFMKAAGWRPTTPRGQLGDTAPSR
jgi:trehalose/maltose transport system substrate-binding protein